MIKIAKAEHAASQKNSLQPRMLFDVKSVPVLRGNLEYVHGYELGPPSANDLHAVSQKYSSSDFAHCKVYKGGAEILGSRCAYDGKSHLVDLMHIRYFANESKATWNELNRATKSFLPDFDSLEQVDASDADKGGSASFKQSFQNARHFYDKKHRNETLVKVSGAHNDAYNAAFYSKSMAHLRILQQSWSPGIRDRLGQLADEEQYPVAYADVTNLSMRERQGSQGVESLNNAVMAPRSSHFGHSLMKLARNIQKRFRLRQLEAAACDVPVPRADPWYLDQQMQALKIPPGNVLVDVSKEFATVRSTVDANKTYRIVYKEVKNANNKACDGPDCAFRKLPCRHIIAAANALQGVVEDYMNPIDLLGPYQKCYANLSIELPSTAEIDAFAHLRNDNLRIPPWLHRPRGAPPKKRKKGIVETVVNKKRRPVTCHRCFVVGHNKNNKKECKQHPEYAAPAQGSPTHA